MYILYRRYILRVFLLLKQTINKIKWDGLKGLQEEEIQGLNSKKAGQDNKMNKKEISHKKERRWKGEKWKYWRKTWDTTMTENEPNLQKEMEYEIGDRRE